MDCVEFKPVASVAIVGAGYMGRQIAEKCVARAFPVILVDTDEAALGAAPGGVRVTTRLDEAAGADLIIEAVPERLELKRELFAKLDALAPTPTILATNSSSLRISQIEDVTSRRDRVLNMHFFGPVREKPMVELMGGTATSASTLAAARDFVERLGLTPLMVRGESTGFLFNRVWRAVKKECLRVASSGVADFEDIDRAWMIFFGQRIGPFGMMDRIGLDVIRDIELVYYRESGDASDAPPPMLEERVAAGHLGVKTGCGFYTYPHPAFEQPDFLHKPQP